MHFALYQHIFQKTFTFRQKKRVRKHQQCNGGILPPPSVRAIAECLYKHDAKISTPPLLDADAFAAEAGCLRYIAGASFNSPLPAVCNLPLAMQPTTRRPELYYSVFH